jgi:hypothetical protein
LPAAPIVHIFDPTRQDLADGLIKILDLQAKHEIKIRFNLSVEATSDGDPKAEAFAELRKALDEISDAFL